jgi:hypothetical protein
VLNNQFSRLCLHGRLPVAYAVKVEPLFSKRSTLARGATALSFKSSIDERFCWQLAYFSSTSQAAARDAYPNAYPILYIQNKQLQEPLSLH